MLAGLPHPQQVPASPRLGAVCQEGRRGLWVRAEEWGGNAPASPGSDGGVSRVVRGDGSPFSVSVADVFASCPAWQKRTRPAIPFVVAGLCFWAWDAFKRRPWGPIVRRAENSCSQKARQPQGRMCQLHCGCRLLLPLGDLAWQPDCGGLGAWGYTLGTGHSNRPTVPPSSASWHTGSLSLSFPAPPNPELLIYTWSSRARDLQLSTPEPSDPAARGPCHVLMEGALWTSLCQASAQWDQLWVPAMPREEVVGGDGQVHPRPRAPKALPLCDSGFG